VEHDLHPRHGDLEDLGQLLVGQLLHLPEQEHLAIARRDCVEGLDDEVRDLPSTTRGLGIAFLRR